MPRLALMWKGWLGLARYSFVGMRVQQLMGAGLDWKMKERKFGDAFFREACLEREDVVVFVAARRDGVGRGMYYGQRMEDGTCGMDVVKSERT